jgi:hypothetical protein
LVLNDQSQEARTAAVKGIARWAGKDAVPLLAKRLEPFDPFAKVVVFDALVEIKTEAAAQAVAKRLSDIHDRGNAAKALKAMGPVAEKFVLPLLTSGDLHLRAEAAKVLAEIGGRDSIAPLEKAVKDNNPFYSQAATEALAAVKARLEEAGKT